MKRIAFTGCALFIALCAAPALSEERIANVEQSDFKRLQALVRPYRGESPWRRIDWLTNITEARQRAIAEDKPIVIFTAADGSPLSRT